MVNLVRVVRGSRAVRVRGVALVVIAAALQTGCAGYQLALQPTATPGPLGVRQLPPQQQTIDPAAAAAMVAQAAGIAPAQVQSASSAPAQTSPQVAAQTDATGAAAALAAPPITARPPASSPAQTAPTVNGAVPSASSTSVSQPAATATAMPSFTATPSGTSSAAPTAPRLPSATATATATASPTATATPRPSASVQVFLPAGTSDFLYVGATMPVDRALASLAGNYDIVYFSPAGGGAQVAYRPGDPAPATLGTNTLVRIGMKKAMSFVMTRPN